MHSTTSLLLLALAALRADSAAIDSSLTKRAGQYNLATSFSGTSFFNQFNAFTGQDPTNGFVEYVKMEDGFSKGLAGVVHNSSSSKDLAYIGVDNTNIAPNGRQSMRLESAYTISEGSVVVADIHHMPTGCGTWPALWLLGNGDWPATGEIDIMETVNGDNFNHITLHTSAGMNVKNTNQLFQGKLSNTNCNAGQPAGSEGCSVLADPVVSGMSTAGQGFNAQGGGVYVTVWDASGIRVYLFSRANLPADVQAGKPNPSSWTNAKPLASFEADSNAFSQHFEQMRIIINTDLCGSWAGSPDVWQSCVPTTKAQTCQEYVANNPSAFKEAYWLIDSIKVFSIAGSA